MILPLEDLTKADLPRAGAKAVNLARLMRLGLPVPDGFCLPCDAYRRHVAGTGPSGRAIVDAPLADDTREAIAEAVRRLAGGGRLAVRSSATAEDLPERSFAGQYDTVLDVSDLAACIAAVKRCWASLWTERAFHYRADAGIDHRDVRMAVIIQHMVDADVAGVLFTIDPTTGQADRLIIESVFGSGEALVSGRAAPDRLVLSKRDLAVEGAAGESLGVDQARRLCELALTAERAFGRPLDIEWCLADGEPYLLQARPVTAAGRQPSRQVWTNLNLAEVLPDVATPMTWSVLEPVVNALFGSVFGRLGMDLTGHPLVGRIAGRAYFNLNTMIACARCVPGMGEKGITEMFGGEQDAAAALGRIDIAEDDIPDLGFSVWRLIWRLPGLVFEALTFSPARTQRTVACLRQRADELARANLDELSDAEIVARIRATFGQLARSTDLFGLLALGQTSQTVLYDVCGRWFDEPPSAIASRLLAGLGNNDNANAGLALWRLAARAADSPELNEAVGRASGFEQLRHDVGRTEEGRAFLAAWDAFMAEHGHHCRGELELVNPRWSEQPDYMLDQLRSYMRGRGGGDFLVRYARLARRRRRAAADCKRRLRNPLKRFAFGLILRRAQRCAPIRENMKSQTVRWMAAMRRMLLELGRRLVRSGRLADCDDVFFLRLDELPRLLRAVPDDDVRPALAARREKYRRNQTLQPPAVVMGDYLGDSQSLDTPDGGNRLLKGVAVNPGVVVAPARVILRAGTDHVRPGEVLVAPFTDPGWTPLFLNAAAIVTDMGGILSHGSIVAREYGIPAVVNAAGATQVIRTGQTLRVDGSRGTVEVLR